MAILAYGDVPELEPSDAGDVEEVTRCVDAVDAESRLSGARALLVFTPARHYLRLVASAQACRPPVQVLIVATRPHEVRAELRGAGALAEVLRSPVHWQEIRRRFGRPADERNPH